MPPPAATVFACDLAAPTAGNREFVLSDLFPAAFGRKRRRTEAAAAAAAKEAAMEREDEEEDEEGGGDESGEVALAPEGAASAPPARYNVIERLERLFGGGGLATGLGCESDDDAGPEYYESDDSFIDDDEVFESAALREEAGRTRVKEYDGFFASSGAELAP